MTPPKQVEQMDETSVDRDRPPGKRPAARGTAFYPRKRANAACQVCRARKTKCDNRKPSCSYCLSVGATCIQSPVDLSAFDPASLKILERLDELERLIKEPRAEQGLGNEAVNAPQQTFCQNEEMQSSSSSPARPIGDLNDIPLRSILPEKMESLLIWSVLAQHSPQESLQASPAQPRDSYSPGCSPLSGIVDMDTQSVKMLLDNFFTHVHCKNPILEETATRQLVTNTIMEGIDWSANSCLALLICALGKVATPLGPSLGSKPDTANYLEAQKLFHAAQKRIGTLMTQSDIIGAQCFFLSGVFLMCNFQPFEAWRFFSQALAACQTLPFLQRAHRGVSSGLDIVQPEADETQQEAIYWSSWKSEHELRSELMLPDFNKSHHSSSNLYPPFFPTPPHPLDSNKTTDSDRQRASWLFYLAEISLRRLYSRIANEILELHRSSASNLDFLRDLAARVPDYETQAHQWAGSLPPELCLSRPLTEDNVCTFVLRGHLVNFFEAIYWAFVMAHFNALERGLLLDLPGKEYADKGLEYHIIRVQVNEVGLLHRHHGTWLMIRACVRSAGILLGGRVLGATMPRGWHEAVQKIMYLLSSWEDEAPELSARRAFLQGVMMSFDS
ncbi:Zn(2)-C6 fungal-type domain-containing protein [Fusarium sp. Ph1]|nr:Zn(2)-C6 fungal-type domain-containing protein [Fusarium sp. Ph1]